MEKTTTIKYRNILIREQQYLFITVLFLVIGSIPFMTGSFKITPPIMDHSVDEGELINDEVLISTHSTPTVSSSIMIFDSEPVPSKDRHPVNERLFYIIFSAVVIFIVYPVRYLIYLLNYLLELE
ncbi:hypothetical protein [Flammeovirga kamogawensis]|uniref:Uncharacterized protein n=1 Tax=Flammeovirga kamogawensis TaxID=373891 RepID=A0ABX8GY24_9BACT|nr:hypothetical protein [Flammeovirga kamogawensis]MBB6458938.1 hypothetical protein [Flammeovirga kamogawensis]QWG08514.1 hypothetical protein KM029_06140 [Flammeovirga kamogawensis]TRX66807.1 hypothetical protein EO216_01190 [Flammeovirga kamogawensis]